MIQENNTEETTLIGAGNREIIPQNQSYKESLKRQLASAISILLALSTMIIVIVFTITAIISNQSNSNIEFKNVVPFLYRIACVFLCLVLFPMAVGIFRKHNNPSFVVDVSCNKFLLYITVFIFLPATEAFLILRIVHDVSLGTCVDGVYQVRSFLEAIFIAAAGLYTWKMSGRRVIGRESLVISVKMTIAAVVVICISIWTYRVVINAANNFALNTWLTPHELAACNLSNTTLQILTTFNVFSVYMSPFLLEFCLSCSALLFLPFYKSKVGLPPSGEIVATLRSGMIVQPIPVIIGLILLLLCIGSLVGDLYHGPKALLKDLQIYSDIQIVVLFICIIANGLLFYQIIHLKPCKVEIRADRTLLWFSSAGTLIYSMFHCHGSVVLLTRNSTALGLLDITTSEITRDAIFGIFLFVQTLSQTVVLHIALQRKGTIIPPIVWKFQPALILIMANIGFWIDTLYYSNLLNHLSKIYTKIYGNTVWHAVISICQPLFSLHKLLCASILYNIQRNTG